MKNEKTAYLAAFVFLPVVSFCVSCAPGIRLNTQGAQDSQVAGTYTVIFFGCNFFNDLETIAFLDKEGDRYTFEPYAPDFKYRVKKGVGATEALAEAKNFLSCNGSFKRAQLSSIIAPNGDVLGYEVRPLYYSFAYGGEDILYTDYRIKDDKVVIKIWLNPSIENMLQGGGGEGKEK
ncbi:MAG: hypothetical protein ACM3MB_00035 [Acidobacteriota bacterium]